MEIAKYLPIDFFKKDQIVGVRLLYGLFSISILWGEQGERDNWFRIEKLGFHVGKGATIHFFTNERIAEWIKSPFKTKYIYLVVSDSGILYGCFYSYKKAHNYADVRGGVKVKLQEIIK